MRGIWDSIMYPLDIARSLLRIAIIVRLHLRLDADVLSLEVMNHWNLKRITLMEQKRRLLRIDWEHTSQQIRDCLRDGILAENFGDITKEKQYGSVRNAACAEIAVLRTWQFPVISRNRIWIFPQEIFHTHC